MTIKQIPHWINGEERLIAGARTSPVYDPATGEQTGELGLAEVSDVDDVVAVATEAFRSWRLVSLAKRAEIMFKFHHILIERSAELGAAITAEHGKVPSDAAGEIARGLENVEFATGIPNLLKGGFSEQVSTGIDVYDIRQPLGVVAGITPFNFPAMVPLWMLSNAIACGNTFILKPSEKDPSSALILADALKQAGVPHGVFNVLHGDVVSVNAILDHPDIAAVSFVGSTPVAQAVYQRGTANGKRVQALGGAKNHMVVLPDADVEMAADAAVGAAYGSAGERCMAISVVVAVGGVADELVDALAKRVLQIVVGPGSDPKSAMGPLITAEHRDKVASYLTSAADEGADVVVDGRSAALPGEGFFLGASLVDKVQPGTKVYDDEVFGPVLSVVRVETYAEAVALVNDNQFGNGCAIFTRDGGAARQFQFEVECGMVGINVPIPVPVSFYSFGGWKKSLFGDTHMYGPEGVRFYTRGKVVTSRWPEATSSQVELGFPVTR